MTSGKILYTARAHTTGGREGTSRTDDGRLDVKLTSPVAKGPGTNPEQLFAVGWSACYIGAMQVAAQRAKTRLPAETSVDIEVHLWSAPEHTYWLSAKMTVNIPGMDRKAAEELVKVAHTICPYSKATHGNVEIEMKVVV